MPNIRYLSTQQSPKQSSTHYSCCRQVLAGTSAASVADDAYTADFEEDNAGRSGTASRTLAGESGVYTEDWHESSEAAGSGSLPPSEVYSESRGDKRSGGVESASVAEVGSVSAAASGMAAGSVRAGGYSDTFESDSISRGDEGDHATNSKHLQAIFSDIRYAFSFTFTGHRRVTQFLLWSVLTPFYLYTMHK